MAGNNNRDRIIVIGLAHGAEGPRASDFSRDVRVRARFTVGNAQQCLPAFFLKAGAGQVQFAGELAQLAAKVGVDLLLVVLHLRAGFNPEFIAGSLRQLAAMKLHAAQSGFRGRHQQRPRRRRHYGEEDGF